MADHLKPTITSTYSDFVVQLGERFNDLAKGLDPAKTTATNVPTDSVRWTSAAKKWQIWNGSAWNDLASEYAINISGSAAKFKTARKISLSGAATGTATAFDGSTDISVQVTELDASTLTGTASVSTTGSAAKLTAARTFNLAGALTATGVAFDGSADVTLTVSAVDGTKVTGLGTASGKNTGDFLQTANSLGDITDKPAARTALELGTAATKNVADFLQPGDYGLGGAMVSKSTASGEPTGAYYDPAATWGGGAFFFNVRYETGAGWRISNIPYQDRFFMHSSQGAGLSLRQGCELYHTSNKPAWTDIQSKPSTFVSSSEIASVVGALTVAAVGATAMAKVMDQGPTETIAFGANVAGSRLSPCDTSGLASGNRLNGSWKCCGHLPGAGGSGGNSVTIWRRYA